MEKKTTLYRTSDLYFSAFLCALDVPLTASERDRNDANKVVFVFSMPEEDLNRMKTLYFGGAGTVKARKFVDSLRSLKSMCHV